MSVPIAQVVRSGLIEGTHYGSAVVVNAQGEITWSIGDVTKTFYPRSANKLMQTLAMVEVGLPLQDELLALASASHSGEDFQIAGVRQILQSADATVSDLLCPADYPLDEPAREALIKQEILKSPLYMNCSGKHAAMLLTCKVAKWEKTSYCSPAHPLQQKCREVIERCTGQAVEHIGIDGCGAPVMSNTLVGLARSFSKFSGPLASPDQRMIATAIRLHPEYLGGTWRDVTRLMRGLPGALAKDGAEGVYAIGLGDGRALALKIEDGSERARIAVAMAVLREVLGVVSQEVDSQLAKRVVLGGGQPVGQIAALIG
ncbi:MAG: asparaginase [Actinomycetales bacterium]|nr:asparaginase [Actinomycetales bacterium]